MSSVSLFSRPKKYFADGARQERPGVIMRSIYKDQTTINQISLIDITITDESVMRKQLPASVSSEIKCLPLLINIVFTSQELANKLRTLFKADNLPMVPEGGSGTYACCFTSYAAIEPAFVKLCEAKIIHKVNADILVSEIKSFLEGRNLISSPNPAIRTSP